jgi:hypothetical protein
VLAGGKATRLPNKPLLPLKDGSLVIESGLHMLNRTGIERVLIVVPPNSPLPDILEARRDRSVERRFDVEYVVQPEANGVPSAIACAGECIDTREELMVVCCDNVFPDDYAAPVDQLEPFKDLQQVQSLPQWQSMHLSRYTGQWSRRGWGMDSCVAGWLKVARPTAMHGRSHAEMVDFLTACDVKPYSDDNLRRGDGWWDVGVADSYARYWRSDNVEA